MAGAGGGGLVTRFWPLPRTGSRLLSADADGQIKCWSMADHLANSWESPVGSLVEGDPIVALSWLHNGVKLALHVEKVGVLPGGTAPPLVSPAPFWSASPGPGSHLPCRVSTRVASSPRVTDVVRSQNSCLYPTVQPSVPLRGEPPGSRVLNSDRDAAPHPSHSSPSGGAAAGRGEGSAREGLGGLGGAAGVHVACSAGCSPEPGAPPGLVLWEVAFLPSLPHVCSLCPVQGLGTVTVST